MSQDRHGRSEIEADSVQSVGNGEVGDSSRREIVDARHDICQKNYMTRIFEATILHKNTRKSRQNSVNASKYTIYDKRWT